MYKVRGCKRKIISMICIICILSGFIATPTDAYAATTTVQVKNTKELVSSVYKALLSHKTKLTVVVQDEIEDILKVDKVSKVTDNKITNYVDGTILSAFKKDKATSSDFDYIRWSVYGYQWSIKFDSGMRYPEIVYNFTYHESASQLKQVNKTVSSIITSLDLSAASDYEKVKAVHDYLVENVQYNLSGTGFSAYSALIQKKSVCQGYSLAMYKLLTEVGVPCRIITGTGNGYNHAWNIVSIDGTWYNVDATWDDPVNGTETVYDYFLKGTKMFNKDHSLDAEYKSTAFQKKYPISLTDYE